MKFKLTNEELSDEFFDNVEVIGIVSTLKGYKFCWTLNHHLSIDFRLHPDIEIQLEKHRLLYYFNIYSYQDLDSNLTHMLYENESKGEFLVPEFKNLDYIWLVRHSEGNDNITNNVLLEKLRQLDIIQMASIIKLNTIRSKENLII